MSLRILHVNEHLARKGGIETYLLGLLPRLEARGFDVHVGFEAGDAGLVTNGHSVPGLGKATGAALAASMEAMSELIARLGPDLIHLHNVHNIGAIQACLEGAPVVVTGHDYRYVCPASTFFHRRGRTICKRTAGLGCFPTTLARHCLTPRPRTAWAYHRRVEFMARRRSEVRAIIAPSGAAARRFAAAGFPAKQIQVLPYFCPVEPAERPRSLPKQHHVTYIGRLSPNKGYDVFVDALGRTSPHVSGLLVGNLDPAKRQALKSMARTAGCHDRLELRGWADPGEIREILRRTTVLVFPSLWEETLGIVGLEALAHGVPVIASNIGGVLEWLEDGQNGRLVPPGNAAAVADAIEALLASESDLDRMGRNGIELITRRFSVDRHVDGLVRLYDRAISKASRDVLS